MELMYVASPFPDTLSWCHMLMQNRFNGEVVHILNIWQDLWRVVRYVPCQSMPTVLQLGMIRSQLFRVLFHLGRDSWSLSFVRSRATKTTSTRFSWCQSFSCQNTYCMYGVYIVGKKWPTGCQVAIVQKFSTVFQPTVPVTIIPFAHPQNVCKRNWRPHATAMFLVPLVAFSRLPVTWLVADVLLGSSDISDRCKYNFCYTKLSTSIYDWIRLHMCQYIM